MVVMCLEEIWIENRWNKRLFFEGDDGTYEAPGKEDNVVRRPKEVAAEYLWEAD